MSIPTYDEALAAVRTLLQYIGEDPDREGLADTPRRVVHMMGEQALGLHTTPPKMTAFAHDGDQMIALDSIPFTSQCEHHLVPFIGRVDIGYIPDHRILGLSKFARAVDWVAARPQVQERLTDQVADLLFDALSPLGLIVVVRAEHMCMATRGVRKSGTFTTTSAIRGGIDKMEFFELLKIRRQG